MADLLCAADGLLPRRQQWRVVLHVLFCGACKRDVRTWQLILETMEAEETPQMPEISYAEFRARLREQERALVAAPQRSFRRHLAAAALASVVFAGALLTRHHGTVADAEELLANAAASEAVASDVVRQVRYAWSAIGIGKPPAPGAFSLIRDVRSPLERDRSEVSGPPSAPGLPLPLVEALRGYGFDWDQPLSVAPVRAWRSKHARVRDTVSPTSDGSWLVRTAADDGWPRAIEVLVRSAYGVRRQTLVFADGRFEVEELQARAAAPLEGRVSASRPVALEESAQLAELDVRLVLEETGLDLTGVVVEPPHGTPLRVTGTAVRGVGRTRAAARLKAIPGVQVDLRDIAPTATWKPTPSFSQWLNVAYTDADQRRDYLRDLSTVAERVPRRLAVVRTIAERYPSAASLPSGARKRLNTLAARHYDGLRADLRALRELLGAPFSTAPRRPSLQQVPSDWRVRASAASPHAETLERLLKIAVTVSVKDEEKGRLNERRRRLNQTFEAVWNAAIGAPAESSERAGATNAQ